MVEPTKKPVLISDRLAAQRYNVHPFTLRRWDAKPDLGFPKCVYVNGRRYREVDALEAWDRKNSREAATRRVGQTPRSPEAA